jgi:hypothetical protein
MRYPALLCSAWLLAGTSVASVNTTAPATQLAFEVVLNLEEVFAPINITTGGQLAGT